MIENIRGGIRLVLFFLLSLLTVLFVAIGNILLRIFSREWAISWKNNMIGFWAWAMTKLMSIDITLKGRPTKPPFFLVCNHVSYIDVVPLWLYCKGTFIAKSEIKSWPFFGWGTKILGVIFIDRTIKRDVQRVNELIASSITDRQGVFIFPEGTSTKGAEVKPFHTSLLQYPAQEGIPVDYASITYESNNPDRPAAEYICWWGGMPFFSHFWNLLKLSGFKLTITFGDHALQHSDRKILARQLRNAIREDFKPMAKQAFHQEQFDQV